MNALVEKESWNVLCQIWTDILPRKRFSYTIDEQQNNVRNQFSVFKNAYGENNRKKIEEKIS